MHVPKEDSKLDLEITPNRVKRARNDTTWNGQTLKKSYLSSGKEIKHQNIEIAQLKSKAESYDLKPDERERLEVLQAKQSQFWEHRVAQMSKLPNVLGNPGLLERSFECTAADSGDMVQRRPQSLQSVVSHPSWHYPIQRHQLITAMPYQHNGVMNFDTAQNQDQQDFCLWVDQAANNNLPALFNAIQDLKMNSGALHTNEEKELLRYAQHQYDIGLRAIQIPKATFVFSDANFNQSLNPHTTIVMRAINTGDMYHIRAAMAIFPNHNLLIWHVTRDSRRQANMIVSLINDPSRTFYTDKSNTPNGFNFNETNTTRTIEQYMTDNIFKNTVLQPILNDVHKRGQLENILNGNTSNRGPWNLTNMNIGEVKQALGQLSSINDASFERAKDLAREDRIATLAANFAPYNSDEGHEFNRDLTQRGHFQNDQRYVIVNFRGVGHSNRSATNAPAMDTGLTGVRQIIAQVQAVFGDSAVPVPMGEEPANMNNGPNLLQYWTWESVRNSRLKQASLLRYLNENYTILGAIGMRSGVIDQMAFAGIKVISLDYGPHTGIVDGLLPDLATSKGWERGIKLENAYKEKYGHVFLTHRRDREEERNVPQWQGAFDPQDVRTIRHAINFYFNNGGATPEEPKHFSHPLLKTQVMKSFNSLSIYASNNQIIPYDLINNLNPYISSLALNVGKIHNLENHILHGLRNTIRNKIAEIEKQQLKSIVWMRDHKRQAIIDDNVNHQYYNEQRQWLATQLNMTEQNAVTAYQQMHHRYSQPFSFDELRNSLNSIFVQYVQDEFQMFFMAAQANQQGNGPVIDDVD